jgi:hypothetical protein
MSSKKAAKAPPCKLDNPGSPAPVKAPKERMTDLEMLAHRMDKMTVNAASYGFNFNCPHPHYWWTFTITGLTYIKAEFLSWTVHHPEITCKLSDDGNKLYVGTKLPERFINILRQRGYYNQGGIQPPDEGDVMLEQGRKAISAIQQEHAMEDIKPLTVLKLPFSVQEDFFDPYKPLEKGYALRSYPHELARQPGVAAGAGAPAVDGPPHSFFVISVCMVSKSRAKAKTSVEYGHVAMTANDFGEA